MRWETLFPTYIRKKDFMAITIEDIAKETGVSKATVSRVINGTKAVSPELQKKVYDAIKRNNFKPNALARGLITNQTKTIGIVVSDISNPVFGALTKGINHVCQQYGYMVLVCESGGKQENELELLERLDNKRIDGLLFAGVDVNTLLADRMKQADYPVVLVTQEASANAKKLTTVVHDNVMAVYDAVSFLIVNGHKRIAFISGPEYDLSSGKKRLDGYKKAMSEYDLEILDSYIEYGDFTFQEGMNCMKRIYEENRVLPTAVMACSDLMAIGAMKYLENTSLRVPEDISIMGFDDSELALYVTPELSTVRISYYEEGVKAAEELFKLIKKPNNTASKTYYQPHKIIRRNSVKKLL